jgi:hypothetical protein
MRTGEPSTRHPGLGVYVHSLGPSSPIPGERLQIVIYDQQDNIVRRFEQVRGECLDPGYVDFFLSSRCRPAIYLWPLVDIDMEGKQTILVENFRSGMDMNIFYRALTEWVEKYGVPQ